MLKVLVVDDEMPIRQWLEFCIEKIEGVVLVGAAAHGAEGYSIFRKTMPDVVITDIRMPMMDGLEMIQMIRNLNPSVYTIVLTSFEDFEYARKAMSLGAAEYILKTEISDEILKETLKKAGKVIGRSWEEQEHKVDESVDRNYLLRSLVLTDKPVPCREEVLDEYGVRLKKGLYYAINVYLEEKDGVIHRPKTGFLQNSMRFSVDDSNIMIVGNVEKEYEGEVDLRRTCKEYCKAILEQTPCFIGVSDLHRDRKQLSEAMMEAHRRAQKRFYHRKSRVISSGGIWKWKLEEEEKYKILFSKSLIGQDVSKAVQIKNQVLEKVKEEEPLDIEGIKHLFCYFMVSILHMTNDEIGKVEEEVHRVRECMEGCDTMDEMTYLVNHFFDEHSMGEQGEKKYSQAVRRAIVYMEKNYGSAIALTDVASHVGLSSEYLSRLFREDTGMKFIVYLNNLRLKHAIDLLEHTNLKVYEVAEQVGYSNLSYFSTVFKKNLGQNPFDYKNNFSGGK